MVETSIPWSLSCKQTTRLPMRTVHALHASYAPQSVKLTIVFALPGPPGQNSKLLISAFCSQVDMMWGMEG